MNESNDMYTDAYYDALEAKHKKQDEEYEKTLKEIEVWKREIKKKEHVPALSHEELLKMEFPPARYVVEPFIEQGALNMISAAPNSWKSWLLLHFAHQIAQGTKVCGEFNTEKTNVMIVNEEDAASQIQDRLKLIGATDLSLNIFYRIAQGSVLTEEFVESLIQEAKEKNVGIIMFDSLRSIHIAEENSSTEMQEVLNLLKMIARENITVVFTHHNRKKQVGQREDAESTRGSTAINAGISGHISLTEHSTEDANKKILILYHLKSKTGKKEPPINIEISLHGTINFNYVGSHNEQSHLETEVKKRILEEMGNSKHLLTRNDFKSRKVGGGETTIKAALRSLETDGVVEALEVRQAEEQGYLLIGKYKFNAKVYRLKEKKVTESSSNQDTNEDDDF